MMHDDMCSVLNLCEMKCDLHVKEYAICTCVCMLACVYDAELCFTEHLYTYNIVDIKVYIVTVMTRHIVILSQQSHAYNTIYSPFHNDCGCFP